MPADLYGTFLVWLHYHRLLQDAQRKGYPDLYFVRYEDVVADPEREFAGMLRFLGLPYEPAVARGWGNKEGIPEREYPWKKRALGRITRDRVGVFRRELSAAQVEVLERLGRHALPSLGYDLLTGGRGPLSPGLLLKLSWSLLRLAYRLPWHAVVHEVFGRSFLCPPGAARVPPRPFPAPAPGAARPYAGKLALSESPA